MNIVIDTNILISSLYKPSGISFELIEKLEETHHLFISDISVIEIIKHQSRILKSSKLSEIYFEELKSKLFSKIEIISFSIIPYFIGETALELVKEIDDNDIAFVATTLFVDGFLWTGDKILYNGLKAKGFKKVFNLNEIKTLINYE